MTGPDTYAQKLAQFKKNESPEVVLLIADDLELIRIIVAWMNTDVCAADRLTKLRDDSEHAVWEWLWKNAKYSRQELLAKSGIYGHGFDRKLETLIVNRIFYPDGTVNSFVQRYLREKVLKLFDAKPKRTVRGQGAGVRG